MVLKLDNTLVKITNFYESLNGTATMNATNSFEVDASTEFTDISELDGMKFNDCTITNDAGIRIPTQGFYKQVDSIKGSIAVLNKKISR